MAIQSLRLSGINNFFKHRSNLVGNTPFGSFSVEYLVIAGGGGTHQDRQHPGGAGGYRSSVIGELSGGGAIAEPVVAAFTNTSFLVTIGAGGTSTAKGGNSVFGTITSFGGGSGMTGSNANINGGSGSGVNHSETPGTGTAGQGFSGAVGTTSSGAGASGAGGAGGAGGPGLIPEIVNSAGNGGPGVSSSITGSAVVRGGGGGGGFYSNTVQGSNGFGGAGGGGRGMFRYQADGGHPFSRNHENGVANTGGGSGGGSPSFGAFTLNGGSGVIILRYPSTRTITLGAGLSGTTSTVGSNRVTTINAGTGNVSWA